MALSSGDVTASMSSQPCASYARSKAGERGTIRMRRIVSDVFPISRPTQQHSCTARKSIMTDECRPADGYDRLASFMGELPENAIYRRFGALAAEDLLYRQAELIELESTLRRYQTEDKESKHEDRQRYALDWYRLQNSTDPNARDGNDGSQWETVLEIRTKLEEYRETVLPAA